MKVGKCIECPFKTKENDGYATLIVCQHPDAPEGYGGMIDDIESRHQFPTFCPLKKEPFTLSIDHTALKDPTADDLYRKKILADLRGNK